MAQTAASNEMASHPLLRELLPVAGPKDIRVSL
jgi:hypothetical protein